MNLRKITLTSCFHLAVPLLILCLTLRPTPVVFAQTNGVQSSVNTAPTEAQVQSYPVRVIIEEVHATSRFDGPCNIFVCDNADFFAIVTIDGQQTTTGAISNSDDITPNWKIEQTANIPDTASDSLAIQIMIRDSDDCGTAADCGNDADVTDRTSDRALNLQIDLSNCATSQAGAISGSISDNCNQKIISAGATGAGTENTAKIHFRIEVDSPGVAPGVFYPNPGQLWHPSLCLDDAICQSGDFDGDGKDDIVKFLRSTKGGNEEGDVWVSLSSGTQFGTASKWHEIFCSGEEICATGDFNGDGKDDIAAFVRSTKAEPSTGDVWVALSTGSGFGQQSVWHNFFCTDEEICKVGDFNGDGKDDVAKFIRSSKVEPSLGDVWVALSNGSSFEQPFPWHNSFCIGDATCSVGDFNGDGKADIASFTRSTKSDNEMGDVSVSLSKGDGFDTETLWHPFFCIGDEVCLTDDFNGDGRTDIITFLRSTVGEPSHGDVWVSLSSGSGFDTATIWHNYFCTGAALCATGDFNGDGGADIMTFLMNTQGGDTLGKVYVALSSDIQSCTQDDLTISAAATVFPNQTISFSATCVNDTGMTYTWTFDDGTVKEGKTITHKFVRSGNHSVTLKASKGSLNISRSKDVLVYYVVYLPIVYSR